MKIIENIEKRFLEVTGIECNNGITLSKFPLEEGDCSKIENNKEKSDMHGEVFTPLWLVDKMILKASNSLMKAKSTHDLCAGYGQFTVRMLRYLANNKDKFRPKIWLQKIHSFSEYQDSSVYKLLYIFGTGINLFIGDAKQLYKLKSNDVGVLLYDDFHGEWKPIRKDEIRRVIKIPKEYSVKERKFVEYLMELKDAFKPKVVFEQTILPFAKFNQK